MQNTQAAARSKKASSRQAHPLPEHDPLAWLDSLPRFISRGDAARYSGCSTRHVDRAIRAGSLETIKKGTRHVLIIRESFARWLRAGLRQSA